MRRFKALPLALLFSVAAFDAAAVSDEQYEAIKALGGLNGVALQCGYISEMRRMKGSMIVALPKRRALGEAFDRVTNDAYLSFVESGSDCPEPKPFGLEVDEAIETLNRAFPH